MGKEEIEKARNHIDKIDNEVLLLVNKRVGLAKTIGLAKKQSDNKTIYRPEREAQIIKSLIELNEGPLSAAQVQSIFREIISISRAAEAPLKVSLLGPEGTYSQLAVRKHFGREINQIFCPTIEEVFSVIEKDQAQIGVVPVENSTEGGVSSTLNCLVTTTLSIIGEIVLRIDHALLGCSTNMNDVDTVFAHEQALAQCRHWLDHHLPQANRIAVSSTAEAARRVGSTNNSAAVASKEAAEIYELPIIEQNIQDENQNSTRFLIISNEKVEGRSSDKISLLLASRHQAGSLHRLLAPLSDNGISMTRIESRPSRVGLWEYMFFIDIDGKLSDTNVRVALGAIEQEAALFKILGCYPRAR